MTQLVLQKDKIAAIDLSLLNSFVEWNQRGFEYFNQEPGREIYKLLAYLSCEIKCKKIIDIGTYMGFSSVALAYDDSKEVHSFDVHNWFPDDDTVTATSKDNIEFHICDCVDELSGLLEDCRLVLIDIDHMGDGEAEILDVLRREGLKGYAILDNINVNNQMKELWASIKEDKLDISSVGHWVGTGIVCFGDYKVKLA